MFKVKEQRINTRNHSFLAIIMPTLENGSSPTRISQGAGDADLCKIWQWNANVPTTADSCVHDLVVNQAQRRPQAPAICAWDGNLTYAELIALSTRLASHLVDLGIKKGAVVPLLFEKSMWRPVGILGVMMAGAASLLLDISLPQKRLLHMVQQLSSSGVVLSSELQKGLAHQLVPHRRLVTVDRQHMQRLEDLVGSCLPLVSTAELLYVVFTSGSTGTPKGSMITHSNFASAILHQRQPLALNETARVYDFASPAFDVAWANVLHPLLTGGCICIPSEEDRLHDLEGSINRLGANYLHLTTSVSRLVRPSACPGLQTIVLGGEKLDAEEVRRWMPLKVVNAYGMAECTVDCTCAVVSDNSPSEVDQPIGKGIGTVTWLVDPDNTERLARIGDIGELWLEGPIVGRGYLNLPATTDKFFIENPPWLTRGEPGHPGRQGRLYRTGDLVRYGSDGTLFYVGRKDQQIKIRGQRIELGEIEQHVLRLLDRGSNAGQEAQGSNSEGCNGNSAPTAVVVEKLTLTDGGSQVLVAFIVPAGSPTMTKERLEEVVAAMTRGLGERLASVLPSYMVPVRFFAISQVPLSPSGKTDRRSLRELGDSLWSSAQQKAAGSSGQGQTHEQDKRPVKTSMELKLRQLWSSILGLTGDDIGTDDSFFQLGGNSMTAIRLSAAARHENLSLSVADVLQWPVLHEQALHLGRYVPNEQYSKTPPSGPYSLVEPEVLRTELLPLIPRNKGQVMDVLPVTSMQKHFLEGSSRSGHFGINYIYVDLPSSIDLFRLAESCDKLVQHFEILRTIFVTARGKFYQAILDRLSVPLEIFEADGDVQAASELLCRQDAQCLPGFGHTFLRFFVHRCKGQQRSRLVLRMSHTQYDGVSMPRVFSALGSFYNGEAVASEPGISGLVYKYVAGVNLSYWTEFLKGSSMSVARPHPSLATQTIPDGSETIHLAYTTVKMPSKTNDSSFTPATVYFSACALLIAELTMSRDVLFGCVSSGRNFLPEEEKNALFPCVTVLPVRVRLGESKLNKADIKGQIHNQLIESLAHQNISVKQLRSSCASWPKDTSEFGFICHYQNLDETPSMQVGNVMETAKYLPVLQTKSSLSDAIVIRGTPQDDAELEVGISVKSTLWTVQQLDEAVAKMSTYMTQP